MFVFFNSNQAKSAGQNKGTYSEGSNDLRFSESRFKPVDTSSPEFKRWFGDSKVVDADGKPLRVYHGTAESFGSFSPSEVGRNYPSTGGQRGFFFTSSPVTASVYAEKPAFAYLDPEDQENARFGEGTANIMPAYLSLQNPVVIETEQSPDKYFDYNRDRIYARVNTAGADGVIVRGKGRDLYVAFSPTQIKSAISNTGEFSDTNPDIRYSEQRLADVFNTLAEIDETASYAKSDKKKMSDIAFDLDQKLEVSESSPTMKRYINDDGEVAYRENERQWSVTSTDGRDAYITEWIPEKSVFVNVSELKEGESAGALIYQLAGQYAASNGLKFIGDPNGITNMAVYRRTENMISLAIKYGTTDFMEPHEDQKHKYAKSSQGEAFFWPGFEWTSDSVQNLQNMLEAAYTAIKHHFPKIKDIYYDIESMRFMDSRTGEPVSADRFQELARSSGARNAHAGWRTLKRAALANSVLSGRVSVESWRKVLVRLTDGHTSEVLRDRVEKAGLKKVRYSERRETPARSQLTPR